MMVSLGILMRKLHWLGLTITLGCGAQVDEGGGGNDSSTHWLEGCDSDSECGSLSCLCGMCTRRCEGDSACDSLANSAVCDSVASCGVGSMICTRECDDDEDCPSGRCANGQCSAAEQPDAGPLTPQAPASPDGPGQTPAAPDGTGPTPVGPQMPPSPGAGGTGGQTPNPTPNIGGGPSVPMPRPEPTHAELCAEADALLGTSIEIDLSGLVETRQTQTAAACLGDASACCNWTWVAYVVPCEDGDLVLATESTPFGAATTPDDEYAEQFFGPVEVTMGCQGMDCSPTCVPDGEDTIGRVRARLEPASEGWIEPYPSSEPFSAKAALFIEADLMDTPQAPEGQTECQTLESRFMTAWERDCESDSDCGADYSGLCTVQFENGTSFDCQLPFNTSFELDELRSIEQEYRESCQQGADCDCSLPPAACVANQCEVLYEPRSEADLDLCNPSSEQCIVVPYSHCCGLTRRAINFDFLSEYEAMEAWQSFDECSPNAGACPPDDHLTEARCVAEPGQSMGRCELYSLETSP